jgi:hypothetical protein
VQAALSAAQAFSRYAGLQGVLGFLYDRASDTTNDYNPSADVSSKLRATEKRTQTVLGVALDLGAANHGVPLDFVLEYLLLPSRVQREVDPGGSSTRKALMHRLAADLLYSGRSDLQLGVTLYALLAQPRELGVDDRSSGRPRELGASFNFRYVW